MYRGILRVILELKSTPGAWEPELYLPHARALLVAVRSMLRELPPRPSNRNVQIGELFRDLCRVLERMERTASGQAEELAGFLGESAFPAVLHTDGDIVGALGQIGNAAVVPRMLTYLRAPSGSTAARTAVALGQLRCPSAIPMLLEALTDNRPRVRRNAASALPLIGVVTETILERLGELADDPESTVRKKASKARNWLERFARGEVVADHSTEAAPTIRTGS